MRNNEITTLYGHLTAPPEMRYLPTGKAVCNARMRVNSKRKDKDTGDYVWVTKWVRLTVWGKTAETVNQYFHHRSRIIVTGSYDFDVKTGNPNLFQRNDGTITSSFDFQVDTVTFVETRDESLALQNSEQPPSHSNGTRPATATAPPAPAAKNEIDEIPF